MLEKLNVAYIQFESDGIAKLELSNKINELVDAVNELKTKVEIAEECLHPTAKVDPYAEQRKWIGKLCRFKNNFYEPDWWEYGILTDILNVDPVTDSAFRSSDGHCYDMCEPVKPDDDITYKGE